MAGLGNNPAVPDGGRLRFGAFELNLKTCGLSKFGVSIKLQPQPFKILVLLASRACEVVTRDEIQQQIWGSETFVDFEQGMNFCIKQIRTALGDDAETPRYIETLRGHGYRFIAPVKVLDSLLQPKEASPEGLTGIVRRTHAPHLQTAGLVLLAVLVVAVYFGSERSWLGEKPSAKRISLVVLPFKNLNGDPTQDYFADGITEALITDLVRMGALRVTSHQSVMQYKRTDKSLREIARELNVEVAVEGSVVRSEERVRITAQLIEVSTDEHVWARSYERELRDILALQSEVARAIATEVGVSLKPQGQARLNKARPVNPEAYQAYLKGRYYWNKRTQEGLKRGLEWFEQAIKEDPNYAQAYAGLADSYILLASSNALPASAAYARAASAAVKALEIDDNLAEAHTSLAQIKSIHDWDWLGAEREYNRAIELDPNYATAHQWYGSHLVAMGRVNEAIAETKLAEQLDPLSLTVNTSLGACFYFGRRFEEAIEQFRQTLELDPSFQPAHYYLGLAYAQKSMFREAITEYQKPVALSGSRSTVPMSAALVHAYAASGKTAQAHKVAGGLIRLSKREHVSPYQIALVYAWLDEKDQAFRWLERAYEERSGIVSLKVDPRLDTLRSDQRFQHLMRRMNFPE